MKIISGSFLSGFFEVPENTPNSTTVSDAEFKELQQKSNCIRAKADFDAKITRGYHDEKTGIIMAITDHDRAQFEQLDAQLQRMQAPDTMTVSIVDIASGMHEITVAEFRALLTRGGVYYLSLWQQSNLAVTTGLKQQE